MLAIDKANGVEEVVRGLLGKRVEIPVHYNLWMRGARFGEVVGHSVRHRCVYVRLDSNAVRYRLKVWYADLRFLKVL